MDAGGRTLLAAVGGVWDSETTGERLRAGERTGDDTLRFGANGAVPAAGTGSGPSAGTGSGPAAGTGSGPVVGTDSGPVVGTEMAVGTEMVLGEVPEALPEVPPDVPPDVECAAVG